MSNNDFEFQEQPAAEFEFQEPTGEFEGRYGEFLELNEDIADKTEVLIFTTNYRIRGKISLVPGARLTDYIVDAKPFIAVIEVEVHDKAGNLVLKTPFLDVNRDQIEMILPADIAKTQ
jgi:uncharacterized protein YciU (UPF0263 family)